MPGSPIVIAGLVPAISLREAPCPLIGMAGTSPAMTIWHDGPDHRNSAYFGAPQRVAPARGCRARRPVGADRGQRIGGAAAVLLSAPEQRAGAAARLPDRARPGELRAGARHQWLAIMGHHARLCARLLGAGDRARLSLRLAAGAHQCAVSPDRVRGRLPVAVGAADRQGDRLDPAARSQQRPDQCLAARLVRAARARRSSCSGSAA